MKKFSQLLLAFFLLSLCSCGGGSSSSNNDTYEDDTDPIDVLDPSTPSESIPDFSGNWSGSLMLRNDDCYISSGSTLNFAMNVTQSGTAVKVYDGNVTTSGHLNADMVSFYSQKSGSRGSNELYKYSHSFKTELDGSHTMIYSYTYSGQNGNGSYKCNLKYAGTITRR